MGQIRLRAVSGAFKGKTWDMTGLVRIGRQETLEVVVNDTSVSRCHAELRPTERGWRVSDLGSTNGTRLNGVRLGRGQWPLRARDLLQVGEIALVVDALEEPQAPPKSELDQLRVEATASASWEEALQGLAFDSNRCPRPGEQLAALLRAGHHLGHLESEEELLRSVLNDAVHVLDAQRGAIVLADGPQNELHLRAVVTGRAEPRAVVAGRIDPASRHCFSQSLAQRCVGRGESILCHSVADDPELAVARSIAEGSMASVLCVLLRTPRRRLGVLHLDRSPWQKPFTMDDLHLADALAANVSAGIESAWLLRKQRDLFLNTITILAQAVELRDEYTGGHTERVKTYSLLLAEHLELSPEEMHLIRIGTPLHDIGKIGIDDAILRKPDRLTEEEFEIMKSHTVKGAEILQTVPDLHPVIPIVRSHHERWDGHGYPDGLKGEEISRLARIVAVADAFDAMTSDRPYRKGRPADLAFAEVEKQSGRQFDPECAAAFLAIRERVADEMRNRASTAVLPRNVARAAQQLTSSGR
ncbi:MAG TPA: HD domain-containing phosphohydrolase [Gemmataceae bacterium]|nr:HD domain-containing phosphohydrolase [Gemmataceae bacterium]